MRFKFYILFTLFLLMTFSSIGQSRKQLEEQRKNLKNEIKKVNRLLFKTIKKEKNALENLKDINQKIKIRSKLIATINKEAILLSKEISENKKRVRTLNKELVILKKDYSTMIYKSYKSKSQQSRMMFLLSSKNFYQAYKRAQYMKQYTSFRKQQGENIVKQADTIKKLNAKLLFKKQVKDVLIISEKEQKGKIEIDKKQQESLIATIKKKEKKYKKELEKKQKQERRVARRIDKLIRDAIARSNKKRKKGVKKSKVFILSPEAKALAIKFEQNKGKLPWPVKKGLVTRRFGVQPHPTIRGITINSTGLHIVTEKSANAICVFNGKVLGIQLLSEGKRAVLVQHGNYITAYNNLEKVFVKRGNKVITGQKLGKIFTDKITGKTKLIFVLFKNTKRLNPSSWMLKQ